MNAPFPKPPLSFTAVDPLAWRRAAEAHLEQLHDAMQAIIAALDMMDGDPDIEPSLFPGREGDGRPVMDDREGGDPLDEGEPHDWDDEDNGDEEPSLGWPADLLPGKLVAWGGSDARDAGGELED